MTNSSQKIVNVLERAYAEREEEPELSMNYESSDYQDCFKKKLKEKGKAIPQMSDEEKKEFFAEVKKDCS